MITSSQHFLSAFQRKHHIFLNKLRFLVKPYSARQRYLRASHYAIIFCFNDLAEQFVKLFLKKLYLTTCGRRMTFWTFITSFDWTDRASLIVRARARTLASFASYIAYSLGLARSHYCARPMRFGLKASTEKAWKDTGKSFKNSNSRKKSEAPGYATTRALISSTPHASPTSPWVPEVFFLSRAPTCAERCAPSVPRPRNFSRPHF